MDRLGLARTDLVGFSIGGWIAADIATKVPERLHRLALIGPVGVTGSSCSCAPAVVGGEPGCVVPVGWSCSCAAALVAPGVVGAST